MKKSQIVKYAILSLLVNLLFYLFIINKIDSKTDNHLNDFTNDIEIKINASINAKNTLSELIFNERINKESILKLYSKALDADSISKENTRHMLYDILLPTYNNLQNYNIRQLHFHTVDNRSFLRFHRPKKYGDDLTDVRYSIKMTNETLKPHRGFEEGRIFNGFRHVYPLIYSNKHIGSVETSFSFEAIENQLKINNINQSSFFLNKEIVSSKVFSDEQNNYRKSKFLDAYVREKTTIPSKHIPNKIIEEIKEELKNKIVERINEKQNFTTYCKVNKDTYLVSFIFLENIENKKVAVIVTYEKNNFILSFQNVYNYILGLGFITIPILFFLIVLYFKKNKLIKEKNIVLEASEKKLKKLNKKLKKTNATKDKFFRIIAHDLINPVGSIVSLSEILSKNTDKYTVEKRKKIIDAIYRSSKNTYKLLTNLLEWSRVQQGSIPFNPVKTELQPLILETVLFISSQAETKQITIQENIPKDINLFIDSEMIKTVVRNFISNAIKFTKPGGKIIVSAKKENETVLISILDTGIGMNTKTKESLFKIAETVSIDGTEGERGTGFGLMICKEFIEKHGGTILVKSEVNKGSEFVIKLPID